LPVRVRVVALFELTFDVQAFALANEAALHHGDDAFGVLIPGGDAEPRRTFLAALFRPAVSGHAELNIERAVWRVPGFRVASEIPENGDFGETHVWRPIV